MTIAQAERRIAPWVPVGAVTFFALAIIARRKGNFAEARTMALGGARNLRICLRWRARDARPTEGRQLLLF